MRGSPSSICAARPNAPPNRPPITSDGAKSPALPPEPMVSDDAMILARHRPASSATPAHPIGSQSAPLIATWTAP